MINDLEPGVYSVAVAHPDHLAEMVRATLSFDPNRVEIIFSPELDPGSSWIGEIRIESLFVFAPVVTTVSDLVLVTRTHRAITYACSMMLIGSHNLPSKALFKSVAFSISSCAAWISSPLMSFDNHQIQYSPQETCCTAETGLGTVSLSKHISFNRVSVPRDEVSLCENVRLELAGPSRTITELVTCGFRLLSLLEFLLGHVIPIERAFLADSEPGSTTELITSWRQRGEPAFIHAESWTPLRTGAKCFERSVAKWIDCYTEIPTALELRRSLRHGLSGSLESSLFSIIAGLESLHKYLYPERRRSRGLNHRLQDLTTYAGDVGRLLLPANNVRHVVCTRNFFGHHSPELANGLLPREEWFFWLRRLTLLFDICLIRSLPLDMDLVNSRISQRWSSILGGSLGEWGNLPSES